MQIEYTPFNVDHETTAADVEDQICEMLLRSDKEESNLVLYRAAGIVAALAGSEQMLVVKYCVDQCREKTVLQFLSILSNKLHEQELRRAA